MKGCYLEGITRLMERWSDGDRQAFDDLVTLVYTELSRKGHQLMQRERSGHMLQTSALVHETYVRLLELGKIRWRNRNHFFAVAAGVMRRILVDQARAQGAVKRGGDAQQVTLDEDHIAEYSKHKAIDMLALDKALERLSDKDNVQAKVVELRYFGGFTVDETAKILGISPATIKRKWTMARSWLYRELYPVPA